jgi:hypothetical protein
MACDDGLRADCEPEDGDLVTKDYRKFWEVGSNRSRSAVVVGEDDEWNEVVKTYMDKQQYWPNVWLERDRGGWDLLDIETGTFAEYDLHERTYGTCVWVWPSIDDQAGR